MKPMDETKRAYTVSYINQYGEFGGSVRLPYHRAAEMVATIYRLSLSDATSHGNGYGRVTAVTVTPTDDELDLRSIAEIEAQVIA
jgi:hypothetical protein